MSEKNQDTSARISSRDGRDSAARSVFGRFARPLRLLAVLATAGLVCALSLQSTVAQQASPQDRIFANCSFTTADLQLFLDIPKSQFVGNVVQASYILIYVRGNPNDGQALKNPAGSFTGPVLCINSETEIFPPVQTTEGTPIPNQTGATVDILGAEEALHLQYQVNAPSSPRDGDVEKRVCHTVAGNTDCFLVQPR